VTPSTVTSSASDKEERTASDRSKPVIWSTLETAGFPVLPAHALRGVDDDSQGGRVHEGSVCQIEDDAGAVGRSQGFFELRSGVKVELAVNRDHLDARSDWDRPHLAEESLQLGVAPG